MKVLRVSLWPPDLSFPTTMVLRDKDLKVTVEKALELQMDDHSGYFVTSEIFEMPDGEIPEASVQATRRMESRFDIERNMAILYYWDTAQLSKVKPEGVVAATKPAPLSVEDIQFTLKQMMFHPAYQNQRFVIIANDGTVVTGQGGKIVE